MEALEIISKLKSGIEIIKKSDNFELLKELTELEEKVQKMQETIASLRRENAELESNQELSTRLIAHKETFLTLEGQPDSIKYCTTCWEMRRKLIQLNCENGAFSCNECNNHGFYDREQYDQNIEDTNLLY